MENRLETAVRVSISIGSFEHAAGDVAGLIGSFLFDLCAMVSIPRQTCLKVNVGLIEEICAAAERKEDCDRPLRVDVSLENNEMHFSVQPRLPSADVPDPRKLLADTVYRRRVLRPTAGLGLATIGKKIPPGSDGGGQSSPAAVVSVVAPGTGGPRGSRQ